MKTTNRIQNELTYAELLRRAQEATSRREAKYLINQADRILNQHR